MKELWDAHNVECTCRRTYPFLLNIVAPAKRPVLDQLVEKMSETDGKKFPEADFEAHKVGVRYCSTSSDSLDCFPMSWVQYQIMRNEAQRACLPAFERFRALAVAILMITADGKLVLSFRSKNVDTYKNMWHVSAAGMIDLDNAKSETVHTQCYEEIKEELSIEAKEVKSLRQLGLCKHLGKDSAGIEFCMVAETHLTGEEVLKRSLTAQDCWEGKISVFPPETVRAMLRSEKWNSGGAATALLYFEKLDEATT